MEWKMKNPPSFSLCSFVFLFSQVEKPSAVQSDAVKPGQGRLSAAVPGTPNLVPCGARLAGTLAPPGCPGRLASLWRRELELETP
jgi:hypothetical protein